MRSIGQALTWELFARGRWLLPFFFLAGIALPFMLYSLLSGFDFDRNETPWPMLHVILMQLMVLLVGIGITSVQGPPSRLYASPIRTQTLVAWHLLSGAVLLAAQIALATFLLNIFFDVRWPMVGPIVFSIAVFAALHLLLSVGQHTFWSFVGAMGLCTAVVVWGHSRYGEWFALPTHYWSTVTPSEFATAAIFVAVAYALTLIGVSRDRCGEPLPTIGFWRWIMEKWESVGVRRAVFQPQFRSPLHAQRWYEWRRKGAVLPLITATAMVLGGIYWLLGSIFAKPAFNIAELVSGLVAFGGLLTIFAIPSAFMLGVSGNMIASKNRDLTVGESLQSTEFEMGHFQATLPMTSHSFANAILSTATRTLLCAWGAWAIAFGVALSIGWFRNQLPQAILVSEIRHWYLPLTLLGPWIVLTNFAVLGLTGRGPLSSIVIVGLMFFWILEQLVVRYLVASNMQAFGHQCFVAIVATATLLFAARTFWLSWHERLLENATLIKLVLAAIAISTLAFLLRPSGMPWAIYPVILAFSSLVVMPWATAPLAISRNRHR